MSIIIGIDLGATHSSVAIFRDGRAQVLKNLDGDLTTPSVVGFDEKTNEFIVGRLAIDREEAFPEHTIRAIKRLMGKSYQQAINEKIHEGLTYNVVADENGRACVEIQGHKISPEEISAAILVYLKQSVEEQLEQKITEAVISVPAYFDETQRQATINAGRIAGLNVRKLINEPTAVTLAYIQASNIKITKPETIVIYDLGRETFDVTIAKIEVNQTGSENYIELNVLSYDGNNHLGGVDIDDALVKMFKDKFKESHHLDLEAILTKNQLAHVEIILRIKAKDAKKALNKRKVYEVFICSLIVHNNRLLELKFELTRKALEELTEPLVYKTLVCCQKALDTAHINKHQIDHLFLVGGMVRMPLVQQIAEYFFAKKPHEILHPDKMVAMGAAIAGNTIKGKGFDLRWVILTNQRRMD